MNKKGKFLVFVVLLVALALVLGGCEAPEERAVRERIAIDARDDVYLHGGADLYVYSDDHDTQKFHIDGATGNLDGEGTANFAGAQTMQAGLTVGGDTFDVDITGGASIDADAASNMTVAGAGIDLTFESEAGSVVVKGDEAVATAITLDANDAVTTGVTIQVGSVSGLLVDGGVTNVGGGSPGVATGDNDLYVTADLEADGLSNLAGAATFGSTIDVASTVNFGTDNLYPLGYASADQQIECGVTATFTDTVAVTASALTTATYAIATQITDPAASAAFLTVDAPAANVFNIDSWEDDYTVGTTGITVYWCAVGNQ